MFSNKKALLDAIASLRSDVENVYTTARKLLADSSTPPVTWPSLEMKELATAARSLAGTLHELSLLISTQDCPTLDWSDYNFKVVLSCRHTSYSISRLLSSALETFVTGVGRPKEHNLPSQPLHAGQVREYQKNLLQHCSRIRIVLGSSSFDTTLRLLSQPDGSTGRHLCGPIPIRIPIDEINPWLFCDFKTPCMPFEIGDHPTVMSEVTNGWVKNRPVFHTWFSETGPGAQKLCIQGDAGSGKDLLLKTFIEGVASSIDETELLCFYFVTRSNSATPAEILGVLLYQFLRQSLAALHILRDRFGMLNDESPHGRFDDPRSPEYLLAALKAAISTSKKTFIVIGDIDMTKGGMGTLLEYLHELSRESSVRIIVSRNHGLELQTETADDGFIACSFGLTREEVKAYIENMVFFSDLAGEIKSSEIVNMAEKLHEANQGFRWIECQVEYLLQLPEPESRRETLSNLPQTLSETYELILSRSSRSEFESAVLEHSVTYISILEDPPTFTETCRAVSSLMNLDSEPVECLASVNEATISRVCGSLIRKCDGHRCWTLGHESVREFLEQLDPAGQLERFRLSLSKSRAVVAKVYLRYITLPQFAHTLGLFGEETKLMRTRHDEYPFYRLAASQWPRYATDDLWATADPVLQNLFSDMKLFKPFVLEYCQSHLCSSDWLPETMIRCFHCLFDGSLSPLHVAAAIGIPDLCRFLVTHQGADIDQNSSFGTPLHMAIIGPYSIRVPSDCITWKDVAGIGSSLQNSGRRRTVEVLLELGASGRKTDDKLAGKTSIAATALVACMCGRDTELFCLLLQQSSELDQALLLMMLDLITTHLGVSEGPVGDQARRLVRTHEDYFNTVFPFVMDKVLLRLLWPSDDPNNPDGYGFLHSFFSTVWDFSKSLSLPCAEPTNRRPVSCSQFQYQSTIATAVLEGWTGVLVRLMQDARWEPNLIMDTIELASARTGNGDTILHSAVENNNRELVEILLENGSDLHFRDNRHRTPLHLAEDEVILRLLHAHGADLTATDMSGYNVWHLAAANNDCTILQCLSQIASPQMMHNVLSQRAGSNARTPIAEALMFVRRLVGYPPAQQHSKAIPLAAIFLMSITRKRPQYLHCEVPLIQLAVEWGHVELFEQLVNWDKALKDNILRDPLAFHCLNFGASEALVRRMKEEAGRLGGGLRIVRDVTPAEKIFHNFRPSRLDPTYDNAHPSWTGDFSEAVYLELLTEEVLQSIDSRGRTLWERYCRDVVLFYARRPKMWRKMTGPLAIAAEALIRKGAIERFETYSKKSALVPLVESFNLDLDVEKPSPWNNVFFKVLESSTVDTGIDGPKEDELIKLASRTDGNPLFYSTLLRRLYARERPESP